MAGNIYDLSTLVEVLRVQKSPTSFFLPLFFGRTITFDTHEILFDKVFGDDRYIAPFVAPNVNGSPSALNGYETVAFKPAYVKMQDQVDPSKPFERMAGEAIGTGSMSPMQRYDAAAAELLRQQKVKLANLFEWMAAKAIIDGKITIKGEKYPEVLVDFRRDASLTTVLTGTAKWDNVASDPLATIKAARINCNNLSGARVTRHIFGGTAWDLFASRVDLKNQMDKNFGGLNTEVTRMVDGYEGVEYMGTIQGLNGAGRIEAWVHTGKFRDFETGTEQYMLDQSTVVGVSEMVQGVRCFGAIKDKKAGYQAMEMFPKMWESEDGSTDWMSLQSGPLMVPKQPNATYSIKVA